MKTTGKFKLTGSRWMVVSILMFAYAFSFMDRYIVNLLVEPMKKDLQLSDTKISLLLGLSFALFYATLGIPAGWLADKKSRTGIISAGITLWSIMTACCGMAKNYVQLFFARMGVGIGESTLSPSAYSLISDYFPQRLLATAISIYSLGIYLGAGGAYILGGKLIVIFSTYKNITLPLVGDIFGWQLVFFLFGIPGLLVALLMLLVKEPARTVQKNNTAALTDFLQWLRKDGKLFILLCLASALFNIAVYASASWLPAFLTRLHKLDVDEAGLLLGLSTLVLPSIGVIAGGKIADHFASQEGVAGRLKTMLVSTLLFIPANLFFIFHGNITATIITMIPHGILISCAVGTGAACIQEIVPASHRGIASAIFLLAQNLIGMGIGPLSVGLLNDYLFGDSMAIGKSLLTVAAFSLSLAALFFALAVRRATIQAHKSNFVPSIEMS